MIVSFYLGSERVKETKPTGEALTESQNINKSLLTLGTNYYFDMCYYVYAFLHSILALFD